MRHEIKMYILTKLLGWVIDLLPENKHGIELSISISEYLQTDINESI